MSSSLYLLGAPLRDFAGPLLPSNAEMLRHYHHLHEVHSSHYSARAAVSRCYEVWEEAGLRTASMSLARAQMKNLVHEYRRVRKARRRGREEPKVVRAFERTLKGLFFVGSDDSMAKCRGNAKELFVASLTMHLTLDECGRIVEKTDGAGETRMEVEEDGLEQRATADDKSKVKVEPNNNNNPNDEHHAAYLVEKEKLCEIEFEAYDDKTKVKVELNNNAIQDDEHRAAHSFKKEETCEIEFEASDDKAKLKIEPSNNTYDDEHYAAYLFEEEWNLRYPKYDDSSADGVKPSSFLSVVAAAN